MTFATKLQLALDLLEAKNMVRDDKTPISTNNILGWTVLFYDDAYQQERTQHDLLAARLPAIITKVTDFLIEFETVSPALVFKHIIEKSQVAAPGCWHILDWYIKPLNDLNDAELRKVMEATTDANDMSLHELAKLMKLSLRDTSVFNLDALNDYHQDLGKSGRANVLNAVNHVITNLPKTAPYVLGRLKQLIDAPPESGLHVDTDYLESLLTVIKQTITRIKALGIRKSAAVPIRIHLVNDYPLSGYGHGRKAGDANPGVRVRSAEHQTYMHNQQDTHRVNVYVTKDSKPDQIMDTLAHEIGHILFSINPDVQRVVKAVAHDGESPTNYAKPGYTFPGLEKPSIHHHSGNEWMAEMFALLITGQTREDDYNQPDEYRLFKRAIATINGHPHAGLTYLAGQDKDNSE